MVQQGPDPSQAPQTPSAAREFLRALLGNVILLLLFIGVERLFFDAGFYSSLIQHPFWIVVLVAAVHDGLFVGVAVAIAATLLMDWPPRPADADITAHYIQVAILPLQWLLAALCIGLFRQRELRRLKAGAAETRHLRAVNEVLAADVLDLEAHMTRAQLETLSRDIGRNRYGDLMSRAAALSEAELPTLVSLFAELAALCTSLPAAILLQKTEDELEELLADDGQAHVLPAVRPAADLLGALRVSPAAIVDLPRGDDPVSGQGLLVLAGIASPDRRKLHGAVGLLAPSAEAVAAAGAEAQFLAGLLAPVIGRIRAPKIAVSAEPDEAEAKIRKIFHG